MSDLVAPRCLIGLDGRLGLRKVLAHEDLAGERPALRQKRRRDVEGPHEKLEAPRLVAEAGGGLERESEVIVRHLAGRLFAEGYDIVCSERIDVFGEGDDGAIFVKILPADAKD